MIKDVINGIRKDLIKAFADTAVWTGNDNTLLDFIPQNGGWTIRQIIEHVSLTNHYLLILIRKGANKAIEKARKTDFDELLVNYNLDLEKLNAIGKHKSFEWNRPEHMEPTNAVTLDEVNDRLNNQLQECLVCLDRMPNGEGVLYKTTMSVNDLGKIDVYHYIVFLVQHIKRHITQMEKVETEFLNHN